MHPTVKQLREIVKGIEGAWVRRWKDGELWVGVGQPGFKSDLSEVHRRITAAPGFRICGVATDRAWIVETDVG